MIIPRKRHKGQFENNNKIYKVTQSRKITSANVSYGLPEDILGKDKNGKSIKGTEIEYNQKDKPLLLIMCIDAKPSVKSEDGDTVENVHKNYSVGITINFPGRLSREEVKLEYQANVVYQHQRDLFEDFLDEEIDEEAEDILNVQSYLKKAPWDEMTVPRNEQSFITRRIDKDIKQNFFWIKDIEGNCGLMLHLKDPLKKEIQFPKFKRLKLFFVKDKKSFVILANNDVNKKSFKVFCHNIIFACSKIDEENDEKLISEIKLTLEKWLTVFEKNNSKNLVYRNKLVC